MATSFKKEEVEEDFCGLCEKVMQAEPPVMVQARAPTLNRNESSTALLTRVLELSDVDQLLNYYNSVALYFEAPSPATRAAGDEGGSAIFGVASMLQSALEELLLHYPAASGRLQWNAEERRLEVRYGCDSGGVHFVSARATIPFCELGDIANPHPSLDLLYPTLQLEDPGCSPAIVAIQRTCASGRDIMKVITKLRGRACMDFYTRVSYVIADWFIGCAHVTSFTCGSFTIAMKSNHVYMDGYGAAVFLQNLCSMARGDGLTVVPNEPISRRELFKPRASMQEESEDRTTCPRRWKPAPAIIGRATRVTFHESTLQAMREGIQATMSAQDSKACSRYVALAAFLWSALATSRVSSGRLVESQEFSLGFGVNLRGKTPEFEEAYVGNSIHIAQVSLVAKEVIGTPLHVLVEKMRSDIASITHFFFRHNSLIDQTTDERPSFENVHAEVYQTMPESAKKLRAPQVSMPSFVNLPFYSIDCGWGRPAYCARPSMQSANKVIVLDHPSAHSWNALIVFASPEEERSFQEAMDLKLKAYHVRKALITSERKLHF